MDKLYELVERLRVQSIGAPQWYEGKQVYEYATQSVSVVAVLKLIRAAHGVSAIKLLVENGLFIDFGAITRCIIESTNEVYFLLENYPDTSENVERFVKSFFENTIDGYLCIETEPIPSKKARAAYVRCLKGRQDEVTQKRVEGIYKTFSGYVHANYAHIMEVYSAGTDSFHLCGVPSADEINEHAEYVRQMRIAVLLSAAFVADKFCILGLSAEISEALDNERSLAPPGHGA
jgi:hypothetical protein